MKGIRKITFAVLMVLALAGLLYAQEEKKKEGEKQGAQGPPPALVVVSDIVSGEVEPMAEFVGTVYYSRVSDVAAEVEGRVERVEFEEGDRVRKGRMLVQLGTDLLDSAIEGTRASYGQVLVELEKAEKDLNRFESLYREDSIAESVYDEHLFRKRGLERKAESIKAELDSMILQKKKKTIHSPFGGVVLEKAVEKGEWVSPGGKVAVVANDGLVDVVVDVPREVLLYLDKGRKVGIRSGGRELEGDFFSVIPRGDVATRTFSVKLRLENDAGLIEGMEASALLPAGEKSGGLLVPRDAVIPQFGMNVVFIVVDSAARMVPVQVTGYKEKMVGVQGPGLQEGMEVVVKGHERLMDGQPVMTKGG
jgi:RND family efflux transporter MFP subunit